MTTQHDKDIIRDQNEELVRVANKAFGYNYCLLVVLKMNGFSHEECLDLCEFARNRNTDAFEKRLALGPRLL